MKSVIKLGFFALIATSISYFSAVSASQFDLRTNQQAHCGCKRNHHERNRCRESSENNSGCCHEEKSRNRCHEEKSRNRCHENEHHQGGCHTCHHHDSSSYSS